MARAPNQSSPIIKRSPVRLGVSSKAATAHGRAQLASACQRIRDAGDSGSVLLVSLPAPRGRFAPSPTGDLHVGSLRTALLAWLQIRRAGGRFVLRLEDLDRERCRPEYATAQVASLRAIGLDWDEGPEVDGPFGPYVQSERLELYGSALEKLRAAGLVYPCYCSRAEVAAGSVGPGEGPGARGHWRSAGRSQSTAGVPAVDDAQAAHAPHGPGDDGPRYPGTCRTLDAGARGTRERAGRKPAWRFRVRAGTVAFDDGVLGRISQDVEAEVGDFVVRRADGVFAYQLAVVVDDIAMGMSDVLRGADLAHSTPRQLLLYEALAAPPPRFHHVPILLGPDGEKLSKRHGPVGVGALLEAGVSSAQLLAELARLSGFEARGVRSVAELLPAFDLRRLPRGEQRWSPARLVTEAARGSSFPPYFPRAPQGLHVGLAEARRPRALDEDLQEGRSRRHLSEQAPVGRSPEGHRVQGLASREGRHLDAERLVEPRDDALLVIDEPAGAAGQGQRQPLD